jgi:hypothetical protein
MGIQLHSPVFMELISCKYTSRSNLDSKQIKQTSLKKVLLNFSLIFFLFGTIHSYAQVDSCATFACNGPMNISVDDSCKAKLSPSVLLAGVVYFPDSVYTLQVMDDSGKIRTDEKFTGIDVGKKFTVKVTNTKCDDIPCWIVINIEDKLPPMITCINDTISCVVPLDSAALPLITNDNCSDAKLVLLNQSKEDVSCDPTFLSIYTRIFTVRDKTGNKGNECTQTILVERTKLDSIKFPPSFSGPGSLNCNGFAVDGKGNPQPSVTGVPTLNGQTLYPFNQSVICNGFVNYDDNLVINTGCKKMIVRTWEVGEWWCSSTNIRKLTQIIELKDNTAPIITGGKDIAISTSGPTCEAMVNLPAISAFDECKNTPLKYSIRTGFEILESNGGIAKLPVGVHNIKYAVEDACGNQAFDTLVVTVTDKIEPVAVCKSGIVVSLDELGRASLDATKLDGGSYDACSPVTMQIRRLVKACGDSTGFGSSVNFCCDDVNNRPMVALVVTDAGGRTNVCMVSVEVQDKRVPTLSCPANLTVNCGTTFHPKNLSADFGAPLSNGGGCVNLKNITDTIVGTLSQCGLGQLTRTITLRQGNAIINTCNQIITFKVNTPFNRSMITYPRDTTIKNTACSVGDLKNLSLGKPIITGEGICDLVGSSSRDEKYEFAGNNACFKVLRHWTVINTCARDEQGRLWQDSFIQVIIVENKIAPTIELDSSKNLVCSINADCTPDSINIVAKGKDDCTPINELLWTWTVTLENGTILTGTGTNASGKYPFGKHRVNFVLYDKCGNFASKGYNFEIKNCKLPTAYCKNNLSTSLVAMSTDGDNIPDTEMSIITPIMFDNGSFQGCVNDPRPVKLSFSANLADDTIRLDCSHKNKIVDISLWVTDANQNQSICKTSIVVRDTNNVNICNNLIANNVDITGQIKTNLGLNLSNVTVKLDALESIILKTDIEGKYNFLKLKTAQNYTISPVKNDGISNGINTLDLVILQRHIMGLSKIKDTYSILAADVNDDKKLSAADLVWLRKIILGVTNEMVKGESWRFTNSDQLFSDPNNPLASTLNKQVSIDNLMKDMKINFTAYKVGDVNNTAATDLNDLDTEPRKNKIITLKYNDIEVKTGNTYSVQLKTDSEENISGIQMLVDNQNLKILSIDNNSAAINTNDQFTKISHAINGPASESITLMFTSLKNAKLSELVSIAEDEKFKNEVYLDSENSISSFKLLKNSLVQEKFTIGQNIPNPWSQSTKVPVTLPEAGQVKLKVVDMIGRIIYKTEKYLEAGSQYIHIGNEINGTNGTLIIEVEFNNEIRKVKMMRIE